MKKLSTLFLGLAALCNSGQTQTSLPNWDMEAWTPTGWGDSLNGWTSTDWAVGLAIPFTVELSQYSPGVTGYAASIQTNTFGFTDEPIIGILMNGNPTYSFAPGAGTAYVSGGGTPISMNPAAVEGSFMCTGSYDALVDITVTKWNTLTHSRDTIGYGHGALPVGTTTYTDFSIPIYYPGSVGGDTICVFFYSADPILVPSTFASPNNLIIDNVTLAFSEDIIVSSIDAPTAGSNILNPQPITATIQNNTASNLVNPNIHYTDGFITVTETYIGTIAPGASLSYTFNQIWTPTSSGFYEVCVYVDHALNDAYAATDTACVDVIAFYIDLELEAIIAPTDGSVVNDTQPITLQIYNPGDAVIVGMDVSYSINGAAWITETISTSVAPGATITHTFTQTWTPSSAGNYEICAAVYHSNDYVPSNDSLCINTTSNLGVTPQAIDEMVVYPIPSTGLVNFNVQEEVIVVIFDAQGRLLLEVKISEETQLDLTHLSDGIYFYEIRTEENLKLSNGRLVVEK